MNSLSMFDPAASSRLCLALVHSVWQVSLLAAAAWGVERLLRRRSVQRSYLIHVAALAASLVLLPLTYAVVQVPDSPTTAAAKAAPPSVAQPAPSDRFEPSPNVAPPPHVAAVEGASTPTVAARTTSSQTWITMANVSPWLATAYLAGVALMLTRLVRSMAASERLRRRAVPIAAGPLSETFDRLAKAWSLRVKPALAQADRLLTPKVIGLVRPTILLPASAVTGMSADELELILTHELAHIRRHDLWVNLAQRLAEAILFFNPALWYLSRRIGTLREYCCDEATCAAAPTRDAAGRLSYARALLRVVEIARPGLAARGELTAQAAAGSSPSELRRRVSRLLGEPLREPAPLSRGGLSMLAAAALLLFVGPTVVMRDAAHANDQPTAAHDPLDSIKHTLVEKFSIGAKAEVLALGTHGKGSQQWWDAQGMPIDPVPFTWKKSGDYLGPKAQWRRVVFRMRGLPKDADLRWDILGAWYSAGASIASAGADEKKEQAATYYTRYFGADPDAKTVGLRIGVANGPWRTVAKTESVPMAIGTRSDDGGVSVCFSEAFPTPEGLVLVVSHDVSKESYRVVAVDNEGQTHTSAYTGGMSAGKVNQTRPTFPGLSREDVTRFEFQIRDYEWVEFKNLPLEPAKAAN